MSMVSFAVVDRECPLLTVSPLLSAAIRICPLAATKKTLRPSQSVTGFTSRRTATLPNIRRANDRDLDAGIHAGHPDLRI